LHCLACLYLPLFVPLTTFNSTVTARKDDR
jgi:hypothetical protein